MNLYQDFHNNTGRVVHKWKHYFPAYERHFAPWVGRSMTFIEIGCGSGGSLQMWKRYLGPHATIVGIDINPACKAFEADQIHVRTGPQQDEGFLQQVLDEFGVPDVVLDDGSHIMSHINATFRYLYPKVSKNGVYMVEDLHTAYWPEFEGGYRQKGSFIELTKDLIDSLNADHARGELPPDDFTRSTLSIHLYDSMVAFEKGRHTTKMAPRIGAEKASTPREILGRVARRLGRRAG